MAVCQFGTMYIPQTSILKVLTFPTDDADVKKVELYLINGEKYDCGEFEGSRFIPFKSAIINGGIAMANDPVLVK